ncbi:hypothetical protein ACOTJQ_28900 [Achromobacter xylosoxidans]|uniref:hypothetical protein n=1 Tax=Achromobacter ruhlandii TaxID=72557 RepID=UPI003B9A3FB2
MPKPTKQQLLTAANLDLFDRLKRSLPDADENHDVAADAFINAEILIEAYLDAVNARSTQLPAGPDLALACAHVLVATQAVTEADLDILSRLNAPALGAPLYEFAPHVADMKRRALAALELMATAAPPPAPSQADAPF